MRRCQGRSVTQRVHQTISPSSVLSNPSPLDVRVWYLRKHRRCATINDGFLQRESVHPLCQTGGRGGGKNADVTVWDQISNHQAGNLPERDGNPLPKTGGMTGGRMGQHDVHREASDSAIRQENPRKRRKTKRKKRKEKKRKERKTK